jgi:hypothetical protein
VRSRIASNQQAALDALRALIASLREEEEELSRALGDGCGVASAPVVPPRGLTVMLEAQARTISVLVRWVELLSEWVVQAERSRAELNKKVDDHEDALRMLCRAVKELDDPYGFGESLDEQIVEDRRTAGDDGEWGAT